MTAIRSQHSRILQRLIAEYRQTLLESLVTVTPNEVGYRQIIGQVLGLDSALKLSEQADYELSGDEPDGGA
jgi:hypothetical protein